MKNMQVTVFALAILFLGSVAGAEPQFENLPGLICTDGKMTFQAGPQIVDFMSLVLPDGTKIEFDGSKKEIIPLVDPNPDRMTPAGLAGKNSKDEMLAATFIHAQPSQDSPLGLSVLVVSSLYEQPTTLVCKMPGMP
jgi:hypothetical protein